MLFSYEHEIRHFLKILLIDSPDNQSVYFFVDVHYWERARIHVIKQINEYLYSC